MKREAVFDTNVLISGVLWRGIPFLLLSMAEAGNLTIYSSEDIMSEIRRVLHYPKLRKYIDRKRTSPEELFQKIESLCTLIRVDERVFGVCSDRDDEKFLSCAISACVNILVSGDSDLLSMKQYQTVNIMKAEKFYSTLKESNNENQRLSQG